MNGKKIVVCVLLYVVFIIPVRVYAANWVPAKDNMLNAKVKSLVNDGHGRIYAGGEFFGSTQPHIMMWDNGAWHSLGGGVDGTVKAIAVGPDGLVYAGGLFSSAGAPYTRGIAQWDGNAWTNLGSGFPASGSIFALVTDDDGNLYVGGNFQTIGGIEAHNIARWDGESWSSLGTGMDGIVRTLVLDNEGQLYAGGDFVVAGELFANGIARWDGEVWDPIENEFYNQYYGGYPIPIYSLYVDDNNDLYASGAFTHAGAMECRGIARWDGQAWHSLGGGIDGVAYSMMRGKDGLLYVGGSFSRIGDLPVNYIARWDGSDWEGVHDGFNSYVYTLTCDENGSLMVGGAFTGSGDRTLKYLASYDDSIPNALPATDVLPTRFTANWTEVPECDGYVLDVSTASDFSQLLGEYSNVDVQNALSWSVVGLTPGLPYYYRVYSVKNGEPSLYSQVITVMPAELIAPDTVDVTFTKNKDWCYFTIPVTNNGDVPIDYTISSEPQETWLSFIPTSGMIGGNTSTVITGAVNTTELALGDHQVSAIINTPSELAITKEITLSISITLWDDLSGGLLKDHSNFSQESVNAMVADQKGHVYAGGVFTNIGNNIVRWDGQQWGSLGSGVNNEVYAMLSDESGGLYVGGRFTKAGNNDVAYIAYWDGENWNNLGDGLGSYVYALARDSSGNVYAGGAFTNAGMAQVNYIARWDGHEWNKLTDDIVLENCSNLCVNCLAIDDSDCIYAVVKYINPERYSQNLVAKWDGQTWAYLGNSNEYYRGINTLVIDDNNTLYKGENTQGVSWWDGENWISMNGSSAEAVTAININRRGEIFVGRLFAAGGGVYSLSVSKWNGLSWDVIGDLGWSGSVSAMTLDEKGGLFVGGSITNISGLLVNKVAFWSGDMYEQGAISLTPSSMEYNAVYGGSDPDEQIISIVNSGEAGFSYSLEVSYSEGGEDWFTFLPSSGYVDYQSTSICTGIVSHSDLPAGSYVATCHVSSASTSNSSDVLVVHLTVDKAGQTILNVTPVDGSEFVQKDTIQLSASASSGLPVEFSVDSHDAVITDQTNLTFTTAGAIQVICSQSGDSNWAAAPSITNVYHVQRLYTLTVLCAHGPESSVVDTYDGIYGAAVTNLVSTPITLGRTQYVVNGWSLSQHEAESSSETSVIVELTNDTTLTWMWTTNYWLEIDECTHGSIDIEDGWRAAGSVVEVTATPDDYYHFMAWGGSIESIDYPLSFVIDKPIFLSAVFMPNMVAGGAAPVPEMWLASYGLLNFTEDLFRDVDGDGQTTLEEYIACASDPTDPNVYFHADVTPGKGISWPSSTGRMYDVECISALGGEWEKTEWVNISATPPENTIADISNLDNSGIKFFRVVGRLME